MITAQDNELIAMLEMAEWRVRKLVMKYESVYESDAFTRSARGLHKEEFTGVVDKLEREGFLARTRGEYGANKLQLSQTQITQAE